MRLAAIFCSLVLASASIHAQAATPPEVSAQPIILPSVVISGQRPGPGLWKVSSGDHVMWILGTVAPVPKKMEWYSPRSEAVLRQAREIIGRPGVGASIGLGSAFKIAFAMPSILRARELPDGKSLHDVLPPDLHARWLVLKGQYLGKDKDIERWRPMFAVDRLYSAALGSAGLQPGNGIDKRVGQLADEYDIKQTSNTIMRKVTDPKGLAKSLAKADIDEVACFRSVLDRLDRDVAQAVQRANAWAVGDVAELRRLIPLDARDPCLEALQSTQLAQSLGLDDGPARAEAQWLESVGAALASNDVSFAVLPMQQLLNAQGLLSKLRAKGYQVVEPE